VLVADALSVEVAVFSCLVVVDVSMEAVVEELANRTKSVWRKHGDKWFKTANKTWKPQHGTIYSPLIVELTVRDEEGVREKEDDDIEEDGVFVEDIKEEDIVEEGIFVEVHIVDDMEEEWADVEE
jgi:hypothetical protein